MTLVVRRLTDGDRAALDGFLATDPDATLFLRNNLLMAGMASDGRRCSGYHAGAFVDGALVAAAMHAWNGMVILYAPVHADAVAREALRASGQPQTGLIGPLEHVRAARTALGLDGRPTTMDSSEVRYGLALADLRVPPAVADGRWTVRRAREEDLDVLAPWRVAYDLEALGAAATSDDVAVARERMHEHLLERRAWILIDGGQPVAMSGFNACVPDTVQIGGVYTPPALRSRGYGRGVVAGSLLGARDEGVTRSVLFTDEENLPARRAYEALGYEVVGDYAIVLFAKEPPGEDARPEGGA